MKAIKNNSAHRKNTIPIWRIVLPTILAFSLGFCAWQWWRAEQFNRSLRQGDLSVARQWAPQLQQQMLQGLVADRAGLLYLANMHYSSLARERQSDLWDAARYNLAGVYLRQAVELELAEKQDGRSVLIELAKLHYRALLRQGEQDSEVAHNLALALAMQPDVIAAASPDLDAMPERSPQSQLTSAGRERLP